METIMAAATTETTRKKRTTKPKKNKDTNLLGDVNGDNVVDAKDGWTRDEIKEIEKEVELVGDTEDLAKIIPDGYKDEDFIPQPEEDDESSETYDSWDLKVPPTTAIHGGPHPMEGAEPVFAGHDDRMDDDMGPTPSPYNGRRYADRDGLVYPPGSPDMDRPRPEVTETSSTPVVYKTKGWIDRPGFINRVHSNWTPPIHRDMIANKKKTPPFTKGGSAHSQALTVKILCDSADEVKKYGAIIEKKFGLPTTLLTALGGDGASSYLIINYPFIPSEINKLQKYLNGTGIRKFSQIIKEPYHSDHL